MALQVLRLVTSGSQFSVVNIIQLCNATISWFPLEQPESKVSLRKLAIIVQDTP